MADASITFLQSFGDITSDGVALLSDLFGGDRMIDSIVPDVTLEETSIDTLTTTDHPVETGVAVSDHSFRNPAELEMRVLWSDSTAQSVGYSVAVYADLQALQAQRQPFSIQTGKRSYDNMLFRSLVQKTDATSENSLTVVATFRELITVQSSSSSGNPATQSSPQSTSPTTDGGTSPSSSTSGPSAGTAGGAASGAGGDGGGKTTGGVSGASGAQFSSTGPGSGGTGNVPVTDLGEIVVSGKK